MDYLNTTKNFNLESEILTFLISHSSFAQEPFLTLTPIPAATHSVVQTAIQGLGRQLFYMVFG